MLKRFLTTMPSHENIKVVHQASAAVVQLHRPEALNALSNEIFATLYQTFKFLEPEKDIVIFKGSGKVFCAGGDVKQFMKNTLEQSKDASKSSTWTCDLLSSYKKPYVALADGLAFGGAAVYAQTGKYRVITERTVFSMPETAIGYFNDAGASYFLARLEKNMGVYLGLTGARLTGYDLMKVNLGSHFVESSKLNDLENKLIKCKLHEEVSKVLKEFSTVPSSTASDLDSILPRVEKCFGAGSVEEIIENLRSDGSDWAKGTIKVLSRVSPTSLKVAHRALNLGKTMSMRDALTMEFRLCVNHYYQSDMREGVRALLVDKDMKPKWNPKSLEEVTEEHVARFFNPTPDGEELTFERSLADGKL